MAALQKRNGSFRVIFRYLGKQFSFTLGAVGRREAENSATAVDQVLLRIEQHLLHVPADCDIVAFIKSGGRLTEPDQPTVAADPQPFCQFKERYLETHRGGGMEANSLDTAAMQLGHIQRTLGERFPLQSLALADLQRHVTQRARKRYRGKALSPVTLRKEVASFRAAWNWAAQHGLVKGPFPSKGLVYPKADEKPPFMTREEVERRLSPGLSAKEQSELWDRLYLTRPELDELLDHVRDQAAHGWVYPLFCFAAHTGARRSEILRAQVADVDFVGRTILVREKKRTRKQRTTRRVPLTPCVGLAPHWCRGRGDCSSSSVSACSLPTPPLPKALSCYGLLRADRGGMLLRFVDGRPVSQVTEDFLGWLCERLGAEGKRALLLVWDNASWHVSQRVRAWIKAHNRRAKAEGGVRIIACRLPVKAPWLNPSEPKWAHGKKAIVGPGRRLTAREVKDRVHDYYGCEQVEPLEQQAA